MFNTSQHLLDINFNFFCRASHTYKNGENPIAIRISYRGERRDILTGLTCPKQHWIAGASSINPKAKNASFINKELMNIMYKVKERFNELKYSKVDFTIDELIDKIRGKEAPPQTLMEYVDKTIIDYKERIGMDLALSTYYKYRRTARYLNDFLISKKSVKNIAVSKVDGEFIQQFFMFLRKDKGNCHNSSVALLNCLKTILHEPVKNGTINRNPFIEYPLTKKPVHRAFLDMEEIKRLQELTDLTPGQEMKRDIFLFACFTGLAYADIKGLNGADVVVDPDGTICIRDPRQKTGIMSIIPLLPVAEQILKKYSITDQCRDFRWTVTCNQILNRELKIIAKKAGITKPVFMHLGRHTFATTVTLTNGVPIETVSRMLGHSSIKHTQIYAKIVASKVKADMSKIRELFR